MKKLLTCLLFVASTGCAVAPAKVYKETNNKVVLLHMLYKKGGGVCSGSFINEEGLVLTCAHCFSEPAKKIFIKTATGEILTGVLLNLDTNKDLAVVYTGTEGHPYFKLGPRVYIGQRVFAFGSPLRLQNTMSIGYVENTATLDKRLIIHDAAISPGSSGGPLVNERGELIGVNEAIVMINILMPAQGMFLAVDVKEVRNFLGDTWK